MWREPESIKAVEAYVRLALGGAFFLVLCYLVLANRLDLTLMVKIMAGLLSTFHTTIGVTRLVRLKPPPAPPSNPRSDLLHGRG
jgi:hypothetical protein